MRSITLAALLSTALVAAAPLGPIARQAPPQSADDIPETPPWQVLTCQAQSIQVRSEWNTAFVVSTKPQPRVPADRLLAC